MSVVNEAPPTSPRIPSTAAPNPVRRYLGDLTCQAQSWKAPILALCKQNPQGRRRPQRATPACPRATGISSAEVARYNPRRMNDFSRSATRTCPSGRLIPSCALGPLALIPPPGQLNWKTGPPTSLFLSRRKIQGGVEPPATASRPRLGDKPRHGLNPAGFLAEPSRFSREMTHPSGEVRRCIQSRPSRPTLGPCWRQWASATLGLKGPPISLHWRHGRT